MEEEAHRIEAEMAEIVIADETAVADYFQLCAAMEMLRAAKQQVMMQPHYAVPFLEPGRLVQVQDGANSWGWGLVSKRPKSADKVGASVIGADADTAAVAGSAAAAAGLSKPSGPASTYVVEVLLPCALTSSSTPSGASSKGRASAGAGASLSSEPASTEALAAGKFEMRPLPVLLSCVADMYNVVMNKDLLGDKNRDNLWKYIQRARASDKLQQLDPVNDMKIVDADFVELVSKCLAVQQKIDASPIQTASDRDVRFALYKQKVWVCARARVRVCIRAQ